VVTSETKEAGAAPPWYTRDFYLACEQRRVFTHEECDRIKALFDFDRSAQAGVFADKEQLLPEIRTSRTQAIVPDDSTKWIVQRIAQVCAGFNRDCYGLAISGIGYPLQLTLYPEGGHYGWHVDIGGGELRKRKLSFTVQLSGDADYEGGEFETAVPGAVGTRERGSLIIFPSFLVHRVRPVTRGERWALVGWVVGPPWQ
jgi:PKHD-type hydroxylase